MLRRLIKHWELFPHVLLVMLVVWACGYVLSMDLVHAGAVIGGGLVYLYMVEAEQHVRIQARMRRRAEEEVWRTGGAAAASRMHQSSSHHHLHHAGAGAAGDDDPAHIAAHEDYNSCSNKLDHHRQRQQTSKSRNDIDPVGEEELAGAAWLNSLLRSCWPALEAGYLCQVAHACLSEYLAASAHSSSSTTASTSSSSSSSAKARAKQPRQRPRPPMVLERIRFGSSPPLVRSCKLLQHPKGPSTAALELDFSFIAGDDMDIELSVPVGGYFTTKLFCDNLRIEGKINLGLKFVPYYPYVSQLSMAFAKVPSLGLSVRPLSSNILAITDLPLIASWVSNAIHTAIQTCGIVEPNEWTFDFVQLWGTDYGLNPTSTSGTQSGRCYIILEILEGRNLMAKDSTGYSDPYVIITYQKYKFKTKTRKQTLNPSWQECFRIDLDGPSIAVRNSGEHSKVLLRCRDRDFIVDDELGFCELDLWRYRGGKRFEEVCKLQDADSGELLIAVTIVGEVLTDDQIAEIDDRRACNVSPTSTAAAARTPMSSSFDQENDEDDSPPKSKAVTSGLQPSGKEEQGYCTDRRASMVTLLDCDNSTHSIEGVQPPISDVRIGELQAFGIGLGKSEEEGEHLESSALATSDPTQTLVATHKVVLQDSNTTNSKIEKNKKRASSMSTSSKWRRPRRTLTGSMIFYPPSTSYSSNEHSIKSTTVATPTSGTNTSGIPTTLHRYSKPNVVAAPTGSGNNACSSERKLSSNLFSRTNNNKTKSARSNDIPTQDQIKQQLLLSTTTCTQPDLPVDPSSSTSYNQSKRLSTHKKVRSSTVDSQLQTLLVLPSSPTRPKLAKSWRRNILKLAFHKSKQPTN